MLSLGVAVEVLGEEIVARVRLANRRGDIDVSLRPRALVADLDEVVEVVTAVRDRELGAGS